MNKRAWVKLIVANRRPIYRLVKEGIGKWSAKRRKAAVATVATS
jgi:hypothetical protein